MSIPVDEHRREQRDEENFDSVQQNRHETLTNWCREVIEFYNTVEWTKDV